MNKNSLEISSPKNMFIFQQSLKIFYYLINCEDTLMGLGTQSLMYKARTVNIIKQSGQTVTNRV